MKLAVVVATRDRPAFLAEALHAIEAAVRPDDEIVVVDSASRDPAVGRVARDHGPRAVYLRCDQPGASRARNAGFRATTAPVVAFTDDDCLPRPGWTAALAAAFAEDPTLGFVTGSVRSDRNRGAFVSILVAADPKPLMLSTALADLGHGANLAVRRQALDAVGGFDELLGGGAPFEAAEDQDLMWRLLRAGWEGRYEPKAEVVHRQWRSRAQFLRTCFGYGIGSGALAVKVSRVEGRAEGWQLVRDRVWRRGFAQAGRDLRAGYEAGAAGDVCRAAGVVVGLVRARATWR